MAGRTSFEVAFGPDGSGRRRKSDELPQILVLGDFSGRESGKEGFQAKRVRFDNLDSVLKALAARVPIQLESPLAVDETLSPAAIDDLHPDNLFRQLDVFRSLTELERRLENPATREAAEQALNELAPAAESAPAAAGPEPVGDTGGDTAGESTDDTLGRLLGKSTGSTNPAQDRVASFIQQVMASSPAAEADSADSSALDRVRGLRTDVLRGVLGTAEFRTLESCWLALDWLVRRLDDDVAKVWLCDASIEDLAASAVEHQAHMERSPLHRLLTAPDGVEHWDLVIWDESVGLDIGELTVLATLGAICAQAGVPLFAHGELSLAGCASLDAIDSPWDWSLGESDAAALWQELRKHPAARSIGLASPRLLIRQPYGKATNPIDGFDFEELGPRPAHDSFPWGNPAYGVASVVARQLVESGNTDTDIEDLPTAIYDDGTGQAMMPPVEALFTESGIEAMTKAGLIALVGARNRDFARAASLEPIALS